MVQSQVSLAWNSYKLNICNGFSALQQNGEFVDMTIAADGHFVKVHQVIIALASPYIKDIITSAPCQHPVIFLNNVSHRTLCLLLEYVYTGEVSVPADCLGSFAETARSLKIRGLENISTASQSAKVAATSQLDESEICHITGNKVFSDDLAINLPTTARNINIKTDMDVESKQDHDDGDDPHDYTTFFDDSGAQDSDDYFKGEESVPKKRRKESQTSAPTSAAPSNLQFTVSIRGSLQVILNRYLYNLQSNATKAGMRRWRCVDYRNRKCTAFVITKGNVVLNRSNLHNHSFHDQKILSKIEKNAVFSTVDEVEVYKEKEHNEQQANNESLETQVMID